MEIHTDLLLSTYTTMGLGGPARFLAEAHSPNDLAQLYKNALSKSVPIFVLGGGSNVIAGDNGFAGLVIRIRIPGFEIINDDINTTIIKVGAGESWDSVVKRTVDMRLSGIETMSGIPGTTGGTPITNVGAYGQEIADTLQSLEAFDTTSQTFVTLTNEQCGFSYRHSAFRGDLKGRFIITSLSLKLSKNLPMAPFYDSLQKYLDDNSITIYTHQGIRDAVLAIRANKLPDPAVKPNAGSFFKNAIVENWQLSDLQSQYPDMPVYDMGDGRSKVPAGWLIEKIGLKGQLLHGIRVHPDNALVLVNESAAHYADLAAARDEIMGKVRDTFRIQLEQEPLEV